MRKLFIIAILALLPLSAYAWGVVGVSGGVAADVTAPTLSSATVGTNGTSLTLAFSEAVSRGASYADADWDFNDGSDVGCTYASGDGTNSWTMTVPTVHSGDTVTLDWAGTANGVEDASGNDLASISAQAVTNNSTQSSCSTSSDTQLVTNSGATTTTVAETHWASQGFSFGSATTITEIPIYIRDDSNGGSFVVQLYTDNAGKPGSAISGTDVTVAASAIAAGPGLISFTLATPYALSTSTVYHIVMKGTAGSGFTVYDNASGGISGGYENVSADSGATWTSYTGYDFYLDIYGCQ